MDDEEEEAVVEDAVNTEIRCSIEYRDDPERMGPGRIVGTMLAYGETITHSKGPERFEPRSLQWGDDGVVLFDSHDETPRRPVGIVHPVQSDTEARIEHVLEDTPAGRRVAQAVREGKIKGLSVEFKSVAETRDNGLRRIAKAWLVGLALVADPAYRTATVEVRDQTPTRFRRWL